MPYHPEFGELLKLCQKLVIDVRIRDQPPPPERESFTVEYDDRTVMVDMSPSVPDGASRHAAMLRLANSLGDVKRRSEAASSAVPAAALEIVRLRDAMLAAINDGGRLPEVFDSLQIAEAAVLAVGSDPIEWSEPMSKAEAAKRLGRNDAKPARAVNDLFEDGVTMQRISKHKFVFRLDAVAKIDASKIGSFGRSEQDFG